MLSNIYSYIGVNNISVTKNLWISEMGVIVLYRIATPGSPFHKAYIPYDTGSLINPPVTWRDEMST